MILHTPDVTIADKRIRLISYRARAKQDKNSDHIVSRCADSPFDIVNEWRRMGDRLAVPVINDRAESAGFGHSARRFIAGTRVLNLKVSKVGA